MTGQSFHDEEEPLSFITIQGLLYKKCPRLVNQSVTVH